MSICEHMTGSFDSTTKISANSKCNIQNELIWGLTYRNYKENEKNKPIRPMHSPIDIPFKICRAETMRKRRMRGPTFTSSRTLDSERGSKKEYDTDKPTKSKKRKREIEKPSLLDRSVMSQSKYMDFLSIPNPKLSEEPKTKKYKNRCELEPCPPRFVQLAVPNKRRVFANWKEYSHFLPTEMLMRYEEIIHTDQNLEPREARYYYKKLDRLKRKELKKKKRLAKKKKLEKEKDTNWLKTQIDMLAKDIVDYIQDEPLFTLNYKQMLLSDGILERLEKTSIIKKPSRKTRNYYKKTVIEVADKFAIWIDTLTRFVDVQAIESDEDIPPVSIPSLSEEGESEGESDYESDLSSEEDFKDEQLFGEGMWGEDEGGLGDTDGKQAEMDSAQKLIGDLFRPEEGEDEADLDEFLGDLDGDLLEQLIQILSNCSEDFLASEIDPAKMPGLKYQDVLKKLKELKEGVATDIEPKPFLETVMIDWALKNEPDKVNDKLLAKIHETAALLGDWLYSEKHDDDWVFVEKPSDDELGEDGTKDGEGDIPQEIEEAAEGTEEEAEEGENPIEADSTINGNEADTEEPTEDEQATEEGEEAPGGLESAEESEVGQRESLNTDATDLGEFEASDTGDATEPIYSDLEGEEGLGGIGEYEAAAADGEGVGKDEGEEEGEGEVEGEGEEEGEREEEGEGEEEVEIEGEEKGKEEREGEVGPEKEGEEKISAVYEPEAEGAEAGRLDGKVIKGHKPSKVFEHSPDTVCCLSLKTWAVWLLEITHNAHSWTKWISTVIQQVREYAATVRGDVKLPNGEPKLLRKAEWRKFIKETEENVVAWRQYSAHVKDLSNSIVENFHGKQVNCCPKCLQDHLIKNVVVAHDTLQALTEAISCAAYWQRCLDTLVEKTSGLTESKKDDTEVLEVSSDESGSVDLEDVEEDSSTESCYEIEGIETTPSDDKNNKNEDNNKK